MHTSILPNQNCKPFKHVDDHNHACGRMRSYIWAIQVIARRIDISRRSRIHGLSKGEKKINKGFSVCIYVHEAVCLPALTTWVTCEWVWVPIYLLRFAVLMFVLVLVLVLVLFLRTKEFLSGSSSTSPVRAPSSQHVASYHTHISARAYRRLGTHSRREVRLKLLQQCSNVLKLLMCCFY